MYKARVKQVIVTDIELRGSGEEGNPYRRITQYWDFSGKLLFEVDPIYEMFPSIAPQVPDEES